jgi:hypothetical protein
MRVVAMATTFPPTSSRQHATRPDAVVHSFDEWLDVHARWLEAAPHRPDPEKAPAEGLYFRPASHPFTGKLPRTALGVPHGRGA